jgi:hypothetical protein
MSWRNIAVILRDISRSTEGNHYLFLVVIASDVTLRVGDHIEELE